MAYFTISKTVNNQYRFGFFGGNHEQILASETYISKQGCENGIAAVKRLAPFESTFKRTGVYSDFRFTMVSGNYETVAHSSEGYTTSQSRDHAISVVKQNAPTAVVYDRS